ncbi:permease [Ectothiorhodospiraceae bacterium WFHF3C12]|nr:permease [Ectothiorhodospiraceae bacterium WFHF3C12]
MPSMKRPYRPRNATLGVWLVNGVALACAERLVTRGAIEQVVDGLAELLPVIVLAGLLAGILAVQGVAARMRAAVSGGTGRAVLIGSVAGALTPVCGLGIVPLIVALQRHGAPLAAIMAFWVSSPVTDPAMLVMTAGVLGLPFAIAKTAAAFGAGMLGGFLTAVAMPRADAGVSLGSALPCADGSPNRPAAFAFLREALVNFELALRWILLALILELVIRNAVPAHWIELAVGGAHWWAVPLAAMVAAPLYLDGYAALPLVRGLAAAGMSSGAALALLVSGAVVSLYSAVAVFSVVPLRLFGLYLVTGVLAAVLSGYAADIFGLVIVVD